MMRRVLLILGRVALIVILSLLLRQVTSLAGQLCVGPILGCCLFSLHESVVHEYLGHARKEMREFWRRHPRLFFPLIEGYWLHHVVHHGKTFRDGYLVQFGQSLSIEKVDAWGPEAFYRLFDAKDQDYVRKVLPPHKIVEHLHKAEYGLGAVSFVKFASTIFPVVAIVFALVPFWMALSAALPMLFVYPSMSDLIHRNIMHVSQDKGFGVSATGKPKNWLLGSFVGTGYLKALERWHWMHHEYIYCNFNLFVLADFFRGKRRKPSAQDLAKMASEGLAMDTWSGFALLDRAYSYVNAHLSKKKV
jgi:hypothetical protein